MANKYEKRNRRSLVISKVQQGSIFHSFRLGKRKRSNDIKKSQRHGESRPLSDRQWRQKVEANKVVLRKAEKEHKYN